MFNLNPFMWENSSNAGITSTGDWKRIRHNFRTYTIKLYLPWQKHVNFGGTAELQVSGGFISLCAAGWRMWLSLLSRTVAAAERMVENHFTVWASLFLNPSKHTFNLDLHISLILESQSPRERSDVTSYNLKNWSLLSVDWIEQGIM